MKGFDQIASQDKSSLMKYQKAINMHLKVMKSSQPKSMFKRQKQKSKIIVMKTKSSDVVLNNKNLNSCVMLPNVHSFLYPQKSQSSVIIKRSNLLKINFSVDKNIYNARAKGNVSSLGFRTKHEIKKR